MKQKLTRSKIHKSASYSSRYSTMNRIEIDQEKRVILIKGWSQIGYFYYTSIISIGLAIFTFITDFPDFILPTIFMFMSLLSFLLQKRLTKMKEYKVECSMEQLKRAFSQTAKIREWNIEYLDNKSLQAFDKDHFNWKGGGDLIIISKTQSGFLICTLPDPRKIVSPFFTPLRKKNRDEFIHQLKGVILGQTSTPSIESNHKEWTNKKIIVRLITYPFCFLLIFMGLKMIENPIYWKSRGAGFGAIAIALVYLFFDIKGIIKKQKHDKH